MVIANVSDGTTAKFDLSDAEQCRALLDLISSGRVSALSLHHDGTQHVLPMPRRFARKPLYAAEAVRNGTPEIIGERISVHAGDVRVSLTLTYKSKLVRCDLVRTGRMAYNPS